MDFETLYSELRQLLAPQTQAQAGRAARLQAQGHDPRLSWIRPSDPNAGAWEINAGAPSLGGETRHAVNSLLQPVAGDTLAGRVGDLAGTVVDYAPIPAQMASGVAMQPVRAGEAVGEAVMDPTLGKVTNAGLQTGVALGSPALAAGSLGLGYLEAARRDLGIGPAPGAMAGQRTKQKEPTSVADVSLPGLTPEQNAAYNAAMRIITEGDFSSSAHRRQLEMTVKDLRDLSTRVSEEERRRSGRLEEERKRSEQKNYDNAVARADDAYKTEMSRQRRFSDTEFGKVYDGTAGFAGPMLAASGGFMTALRHGDRGVVNRLVSPAVAGTGGAFLGASAPLYYNAYLTEPDNPERNAMLARARELPEGHPEKERSRLYGEGLPEQNPVRKQANKDMTETLDSRLAAAVLEGIPSGLFGSELGALLHYGGRGVGNALMYPFRGHGTPPQPQTRTIIQRTDSLGRTYHVDSETGRRVPRP